MGAGPSGRDGARPAFPVARAFGCLTGGGWVQQAGRFAEVGFASIIDDHCSFGLSGGWPRFAIDPWRHILDWRRVIIYSQGLPGIGCNRRSAGYTRKVTRHGI